MLQIKTFPQLLLLALLAVGCSAISSQSGVYSKQSTSLNPPSAQKTIGVKALSHPSSDSITKHDLLDKIKQDYAYLKSLKATVKFTFLSARDNSKSACQATLLWQRPKKILVKAHRELTPNFFTLASNPEDFWFYIPRYNTAYTGYTQLLEMNSFGRNFEIGLDPYLLENALLARPTGDDEFAKMTRESTGEYLLSIFENKEGVVILRRKYWIDSQNLDVVREIKYSSQGISSFEIKRSKFKSSGYLRWPDKIEFTKLQEGKTVIMEFLTLKMNPVFPNGQFDYSPPIGVIIETVN
jgi:hypothetical protein